jgi:hypothetical protein
MPILAWLPLIDSTVTVTSAPIMTLSPNFLVTINMRNSLLRVAGPGS